MEQAPGLVVPDPKGFIPAHGREELVVGAKANPHDRVAVAGERKSDAICWEIVDADVPFVVAVGWRPRSGEERHAGAGGVEDLGAETIGQAAADMRLLAELGFDVQSRDYTFDVFGQHALVFRVHLPQVEYKSPHDGVDSPLAKGVNSVRAQQGILVLLVYTPENDLPLLGTISVIHGARDQCSRVYGVEKQSVYV